MPRWIEGKTKKIEPLGAGLGRFYSKDDMSAGNGQRHHVVPGKGKLANSTTCSVFDLLQFEDVPLAYIDRDGDTFIAQMVKMIPVEIVVRNEAAGSFCKRNSGVAAGTVFVEPIVEFFYKTSNGRCMGEIIPVDDPLMVFSDDGTQLSLHDPAEPVDPDHPLLHVKARHLSVDECRHLYLQLQECRTLALLVNNILRKAWKQEGGRLIDFKIECGEDVRGEKVVADVIDCDSWRVMWRGMQLSKKPYREGEDPEKMLEIYRIADQIVSRFSPLASIVH